MKQIFEGYTLSTIKPVWTYWNYLNLGTLIQKTKQEALIRYADDGLRTKNKIIKVRITIEEIK